MSKTFEFQEQLKTLPLSNLDDAGQNFLNWVEPLLSKEQFTTTKNSLKNFMNKDGRILENKLEEWSKQNDGNWLAPLWRDMYLDIREPVAIDVNYFVKIITKDLKTKYSYSQIASVMIHKLMDIYESISNETFEPEKIRNTPICMAAYKKMFKATRVPKLIKDEYIVQEKTKQSHIVVFYQNQMFKINLTNENGEKYSSQIIMNTLNKLTKTPLKQTDIGVGIITTATRDKAAVVLEDILSIEKNSKNFEILKDALFAVCIDENSKDIYEFGKTLIGSNANNRYFDKNLQLILNKDGDFGFNLEHTGADAGSWITVINMVYQELGDIEEHLQNRSSKSTDIEKIDWELSSEITKELHQIENEHNAKVNDIEFQTIHFQDFGSNAIKSLKYSPDAFLQLALQLAQYRTYGKLKSTYEAVATRIYRNGRTECTRPISTELLDFIKAFEDKKTDTQTLQNMMSDACQKQSSRVKDCLGSNGVERYFFALKNMYTLFAYELNLDQLPEFFNDLGYQELTYSYISTSRIESKYFDLGGFGPVVPDGYGFWYNLLEKQIDMNLITRKSINGEKSQHFKNAIITSLNDLMKLASK